MAKKIRYAPLSSSFMLTSIIGFFISIWLVMPIDLSWGFSMAFVFVIMFVASLISMTKAEPVEEHMDELAIHEMKKVRKKRREI